MHRSFSRTLGNLLDPTISGGEEGALKGPSIMPSGEQTSWELVQPIFEAMSAKVDGEPCVTYIGKGGSGHFVKMVQSQIKTNHSFLQKKLLDMSMGRKSILETNQV